MSDEQPRSGDIYVAQGVSLGKEAKQSSRGAATYAAAPRLVFCPIHVPSAYALGYVDIAAPRLDFFTTSERSEGSVGTFAIFAASNDTPLIRLRAPSPR